MTWLTNPYRFGAPPLLIGARRYWRLVGLPVRGILAHNLTGRRLCGW